MPASHHLGAYATPTNRYYRHCPLFLTLDTVMTSSFNFVIATAITIFLVFITVTIHYEVLRLISEIILEDGTNVNKEMVKSGLAWHYKKYSSNLEYARLEELAMKNKVGLWSDPNAVSPWSFRK